MECSNFMDDSIPESNLELIVVDGERRVDSRIIAKGINIQHESVMKTIRKFQHGLEKYGKVRFEIGSSGKTRQKQNYAFLNKEQVGYLLMFVKMSEKVRLFREDVYDKFLEYEKQQSQPSLPPSGFINSLWIDRAKLFNRYTRIPTNMFCIFEEISMPFFKIEQRGYELPGKAVPDGSVGRRWCDYAREVLHLDMSLVKEYPHHYPDHRGTVNANIYPIAWQGQFTTWFREVYIPVHLPVYLKGLKASKEEIKEILKGFGVNPQIEGK